MTGAKVVLSSAWRLMGEFSDGEYISNKVDKYRLGCSIFGEKDDEHFSSKKLLEVLTKPNIEKVNSCISGKGTIYYVLWNEQEKYFYFITIDRFAYNEYGAIGFMEMFIKIRHNGLDAVTKEVDEIYDKYVDKWNKEEEERRKEREKEEEEKRIEKEVVVVTEDRGVTGEKGENLLTTTTTTDFSSKSQKTMDSQTECQFEKPVNNRLTAVDKPSTEKKNTPAQESQQPTIKLQPDTDFPQTKTFNSRKIMNILQTCYSYTIRNYQIPVNCVFFQNKPVNIFTFENLKFLQDYPYKMQ